MTDADLINALSASTAFLFLVAIIQQIRFWRTKSRLKKVDQHRSDLQSALGLARESADTRIAELGASHDKSRTQLETAIREQSERYRALLEQGKTLASAPSRIQHDVSGRLSDIAKLLHKENLGKELETHLVRELMLISEKIELHIQPNIAEYVKAKVEAGDSGRVTADNANLWNVIEGIVSVDKYENVRMEASEAILLTGSWVHWDLMLANIIANAVESAKPRGSSVTISARQTGSKLYIDIVNEGDHVPESIRQRVFEWGVTTKQATTNALTGNVMLRGNGLYVAQQIAMGLGGNILAPENLTTKKSLFGKRQPAVKFSIVDLELR